MFPESVRNATHTAAVSTQIGMKSVYGFSRNALWIVFSTSIILFAPVIFEVERAQMEEMHRNQQKQMLLGPNTAVSGGGMPLMPPMQR
jgi:import receptor subunit TOM22